MQMSRMNHPRVPVPPVRNNLKRHLKVALFGDGLEMSTVVQYIVHCI